ncbi:MAG TPA: RICIN domain-containing protein [Cytophagales bacterium]|nr:RICIN domain-containing protein [Cytophagales bacterium]
MKKLLLVFTLSMFIISNKLLSQTIVPVNYYKMLSWDTSPYKSFKLTGGTANPWYDTHFRLLWPQGYDSSLVSTTNYPIMIMLHGAGESALGNAQFGQYPTGDPRRFNNDHQLLHQGQQYVAAVNNGKWPGFVLFPQNSNGFWTGATWYLEEVTEIIKALSQSLKIDPNRIYVSGLSAGAHGVWESLSRHPELFAAAVPMSGIGYPTYENTTKVAHLPIWYFQGAIDTSPSQYTADQTINQLKNVGGTPRYTIYPNTGHDTWNKAIAEPDFFPFLLQSNKLNIHVYYGKQEFCEAETLNVKLGVSPGFSDYEWKKDEVLIADADTNFITVTDAGSYSVRFLRESQWTEWSTPAVLKHIAQAASPEIIADGTTTLPGLNGKTNVVLTAPEGYSVYKWSTGATTRSILVGIPGSYSVQVGETAGCLSQPSAPQIVTLNGTNAPAAPSDLTVAASGSSSLNLTWTDNSSDEKGFEIYRSTTDANYNLITILPANATSFSDLGLSLNGTYFYQLRAVNDNGGSSPVKVVYKNESSALVTIYEDCSYGGYAVELEEGEYTAKELRTKGIRNDELSSIKVKTGYEVQLFEHDRFRGAKLTVNSDLACLVENGWNDKVSSIKVITSGVQNLTGVYYIQNRNSGLNLDVTSSSTADGANIQQWTPNGTKAQHFRFNHKENGTYQILSANSGKSIDVSGASTTDGANIIQWRINGGKNQEFIVQSTNDGYYKIIARHSNKILDVENSGKNSGAKVYQWTDNGQTSGQWKLIPVDNSYSNLIQAEDFDNMDGIWTERTEDEGGGENVAWIDSRDWMSYHNINIPSSGSYKVEYRVSSYYGGKLSLDINEGSTVLGKITIPRTRGWQNWITISHTVHIPEGTHNFGIYAQRGGWNINWFRITKINSNLETETQDENEFAVNFRLFPNPVSDRLYLDSHSTLKGAQIIIINTMGDVVVNTSYKSDKIDVSNLRDGLYTFILIKDGHKTSKRFIKH